MSCKQASYSGWSDCNSKFDLMNGFELYNKGTEFTAAQAESLTYIRTLIANVALASRVGTAIPIDGFENTSDDINIVTTPLGKKYASGKPIPSGLVYVDGSLCDYKTIKDMEGASLSFVPSFQNGSRWLTTDSEGVKTGFSVRLATKFGLPPEDKTQSFPVYLFFDSYTEFENITIVTPEFEFSDVMKKTPVGLDLEIVTPYATGGNVVVKVSKRCSDEVYTGLAAGKFIVVGSNADPIVAVTTVVEDGQGQYTLTIKADSGGTPADLTDLQYATIQAQDDDATYATHLSNVLKIKGTA